ncbi:hypothetical protein JCM31447_01860 [Fluviispira sanaruensis]|uniref:Uncharacterized protein n=1 Tax=Fluviispira sanaruensis TaxID=2493639 RepID=A0A4P2VHJ7_FLUSA|nr:hypothetical protein JCM31447_01860 [Fluviispira sanaruensis]
MEALKNGITIENSYLLAHKHTLRVSINQSRKREASYAIEFSMQYPNKEAL